MLIKVGVKMFKLGIIEESLKDRNILDELKPYFYSQRIENVTETLKAENQMLWVQRMNSIHNRATEVVNADLIYA